LKELKLPVNIAYISIKNSRIYVENHVPHSDVKMKLTLNKINGFVTNISNIKDQSDVPIKMSFHAKLMNIGDLKANFNFPMNDKHNYFYFDGSLGSSKFKYYDDIIYPALGIKIIQGELDQLTYKAKANNYSASGTMKFLYHDLSADIFKKNSHERNKFLSWAVTTVLQNSNPIKHKEVRIATMYHKHEKYRGFGGYLWKTLQSGIVNTISPLGNKTSRKGDEMIEKNKAKNKKR